MLFSLDKRTYSFLSLANPFEFKALSLIVFKITISPVWESTALYITLLLDEHRHSCILYCPELSPILPPLFQNVGSPDGVFFLQKFLRNRKHNFPINRKRRAAHSHWELPCVKIYPLIKQVKVLHKLLSSVQHPAYKVLLPRSRITPSS